MGCGDSCGQPSPRHHSRPALTPAAATQRERAHNLRDASQRMGNTDDLDDYLSGFDRLFTDPVRNKQKPLTCKVDALAEALDLTDVVGKKVLPNQAVKDLQRDIVVLDGVRIEGHDLTRTLRASESLDSDQMQFFIDAIAPQVAGGAEVLKLIAHPARREELKMVAGPMHVLIQFVLDVNQYEEAMNGAQEEQLRQELISSYWTAIPSPLDEIYPGAQKTVLPFPGEPLPKDRLAKLRMEAVEQLARQVSVVEEETSGGPPRRDGRFTDSRCDLLNCEDSTGGRCLLDLEFAPE
eukprot:TRINITY_DN14597_c0_g1_i1.p1 TRINITY_DN14597_c0_g1~~TRINITY_DN14597_c0_g1_i1.p1  ORF type:complete len:294 (+),score=44.05 TRINITY_DN14597_c0_g1_i1:173-1054(+)